MNAKRFCEWYLMTSTLVGVPVLLAILVVAAERIIYTATCETVRYRCERSITQSVDYIAEQVTEDHDVVITPKKRR
jgi:hypothetical protein